MSDFCSRLIKPIDSNFIVEKRDLYKERNLGYRASDIHERFYVGIRECMEHNLEDDWCGDCNTIYGKNHYIQDDKDYIEYFYLSLCSTTSDIFSGQYILDKTEEIEVTNSVPSIEDSILIQCPSEYFVQIKEVNYGHKLESDKDDFCYSPNSYTNHIDCNHNVSMLSL